MQHTYTHHCHSDRVIELSLYIKGEFTNYCYSYKKFLGSIILTWRRNKGTQLSIQLPNTKKEWLILASLHIFFSQTQAIQCVVRFPHILTWCLEGRLSFSPDDTSSPTVSPEGVSSVLGGRVVGCGGGGVSWEGEEEGGSVLITESLSSSESWPIRSWGVKNWWFWHV